MRTVRPGAWVPLAQPQGPTWNEEDAARLRPLGPRVVLPEAAALVAAAAKHIP